MLLASGSPQRRAILEQLGVAFEVVVTGVSELTSGPPEEIAVENARRKARAAAAVATGSVPTTHPHRSSRNAEIILGVDTLVALDGRVYGKPRDREEAVATLSALTGRSHRVVSGICVIEAGEARTATAVTDVKFRPLSEAAIAWYADTEEWRGRAGGYAIQGRGAALVEFIHGDYLNVVGLPVATLIDLLPSLLFSAI